MLVRQDSVLSEKIFSDSVYFAYYIDSIAQLTINNVLIKELETRFVADSAALRDSITKIFTRIDSLGLELVTTEGELLAKITGDSSYFETQLQVLRDSLGKLDNSGLEALKQRFVTDSANVWTNLNDLNLTVLKLQQEDDSIRLKVKNDSIYFESLISGLSNLDSADLAALEIRFETDSASLRDSIRMLVRQDSVLSEKIFGDSVYFAHYIDSIADIIQNNERLNNLELRFIADSAALRDSIARINYLIDSLGLVLSQEDQLIYSKILSDSLYAHQRIDSLKALLGKSDSTLFNSLELRFEAESISVWNRFNVVTQRIDSIILWNKAIEAKMKTDSLYFDSLIVNIDAVDSTTFAHLMQRFETDSTVIRDSLSHFVKMDSMLYRKIVSDSAYFSHWIDSLVADIKGQMVDTATFRDSIEALKKLITQNTSEQTTIVVASMTDRPVVGTVLGDVVIVENNGAGYREVFIWADSNNDKVGDRWESTEKSAIGSGYDVYWFKLPVGGNPSDVSIYAPGNIATFSAATFDENGYDIQTGEDFEGKYVFAYPEIWGKPQFAIRDYPVMDGMRMYTVEINGIKYLTWTVFVSMTTDYVDTSLKFKAVN